MKKSIDWDKIKLEYATTSCSIADIAKEYDIPYDTVYYHYAHNDWHEARCEHNHLLLRKTSSRMSRDIAKHYKTIYSAADKLVQRIDESIGDTPQAYYKENEDGVEYKSEQINTQFLGEIARLLREAVALNNNLYGVLSEAEWQQIETDRMGIRAKVEAATIKVDTGESNSGGVIILPSRNDLEVEDDG